MRKRHFDYEIQGIELPVSGAEAMSGLTLAEGPKDVTLERHIAERHIRWTLPSEPRYPICACATKKSYVPRQVPPPHRTTTNPNHLYLSYVPVARELAMYDAMSVCAYATTVATYSDRA